ncbi:Hyaluronan synthase [compost metagenome]
MTKKNNSIKVALLISTYNWPEALTRCFESVLFQTLKPYEILIADDGSTEDTKLAIDNFREMTSIPIKHIWHEDNGFRLAEIRNKAIAACSAEYIIQIDGDIVMEHHFIEDHIRLSEQGHFIVGSRALLNKDFSQELTKNQNVLDLKKLKAHCSNQLNAIRIPILTKLIAKSYKTKGKYRYYSKGCNMSFWTASILEVNGYNEEIRGWGSEDEELVARLFKLNQQKLFLKFSGIAFHIWHPLASRQNSPSNNKIFENTINSKDYKTKKGIDQYL